MSDHVEVLRRMRMVWPLAVDEGPALDAALAALPGGSDNGL